ncbi:energy transducer TonB [Granulicella rosea]|nr:energy transducer TonB [Granulicella rosea]
MFEDSLFSSQPQPATSRKRWTTVASIGIQCAIAGAIIAVPMLNPETLHTAVTPPSAVFFMHREPPPPPKPVPVRLAESVTNSVSTTPQPMVERIHSALPSRPAAAAADDGPAPLIAMNSGMGNGSAITALTGTGTGTGVGVSVSAAPGGEAGRPGTPPRISSGVSKGMLITEIKPVYPTIARAARVQGTIMLSAVIDKTGRITGLQVVSGPEMLRGAALDAVRGARYRPFLLNGEPTEVLTTISVNFRMDGQA